MVCLRALLIYVKGNVGNMRESNLSTIDKKVLGALIILADDHMVVNASTVQIAQRMGYKKSGGAVTYALRMLEANNFITLLGKGMYKVLL